MRWAKTVSSGNIVKNEHQLSKVAVVTSVQGGLGVSFGFRDTAAPGGTGHITAFPDISACSFHNQKEETS